MRWAIKAERRRLLDDDLARALVFPYSDVAKSHVCQKETKGCQKERMGGNKRSFLWSFDVAAGRYYRYIPHMQKKTRPTVNDTDQSRSPTAANYMCLDLVQLKSGLGATFVAFTTGHRRWKIFFCCLHSLIMIATPPMATTAPKRIQARTDGNLCRRCPADDDGRRWDES